MSFDYESVPGDYQYRALHSGPRMQRFWHGGKLTVVDRLIRPHLREGSRILEVGCGAGNLLLHAAAAGTYPLAVDLALPALVFVRSRLQRALAGPGGPSGFACIQARSDAIPFRDHSVDCVLLSEVVEHLDAPEETVAEAVRVLRPGGRLLVTTPNYRSFWPVLEWMVDRLQVAPRMAGEQHITRFDPPSLRRLLSRPDVDTEYFGAVYGLSPFAALCSPQWAHSQLQRELLHQSLRRMILVAVCVKR